MIDAFGGLRPSRTRCFDQRVNREQAKSLDPSRRAFMARAGAAAIAAVISARAATGNAIDYVQPAN